MKAFIQAAQPPNPSTMKRLVICCDGNHLLIIIVLISGTWLDDEAPTMKSPSNVTLISRAIKKRAADNTDQIVYYQQGIGTSLGILTRVRSGAFGLGLKENVREAYGFIVHNYQPGDEIYFFGFSRGAYTARSVCGLVCTFGLLTPRGMDGISYVIAAYENKTLTTPKVFAELTSKYERITPKVPIPVEFIGVWDTVGSYGVPDMTIMGVKPPIVGDVVDSINRQFDFSDTSIHPSVKNAMQAYVFP
jgi:uncharacterized protein (DUF2235 family)